MLHILGAGIEKVDQPWNTSNDWFHIDRILVHVRFSREHGVYLTAMSSDQTDLWSISDESIEGARRLEKYIHQIADLVIDPPVSDPKRCIAPAYFPEVWEEPAPPTAS